MSSSTSSSTPHRSRGGGDNSTSSSSKGEDRPRSFDSKAKIKCWSKADVAPGRHRAKTPLVTSSVSASATVRAASASSTITLFPSQKVVNPQKTIVRFFKQE